MNSNIYSKLAKSNIRKNYRFFVPRILTEVGLLGCLYIMFTLTIDKQITGGFGGEYISIIMGLGTILVTILSTILMIYSNSFLMKQRKPEFGLYHCLGMEKRHVGKVLFHESLICSLVSIVGGAAFGILFYKVCALIVCKILNIEAVNVTGFYYIKPISVIPPMLLFFAIDVVAYIINRISIARLRPIELMNSGHKGEKEPKIRWVLLVIGILTLGAGYTISLSIETPLAAIYLFFLAVLLVVVGTYCLFVSGSIFVLNILKRNEKFYYNKLHMPSVSGLIYRMKQNAVGLASIAILATCILVMISTTVSLYTGADKTIKKFYPHHVTLSINRLGVDHFTKDDAQKAAYDTAEKVGLEIDSIEYIEYIDIAARQSGTVYTFEQPDDYDLGDCTDFTFVRKTEYEHLTGQKVDLSGHKIICVPLTANLDKMPEKITINGIECETEERYDAFPIQSELQNFTSVYGIVAEDELIDEWYEMQKEEYGNNCSEFECKLGIMFTDEGEYKEKAAEYKEELCEQLEKYDLVEDGAGYINYLIDDVEEIRSELYTLYGSFFFLGIILGIVFIFATGLIIYYKQISEGFEDRERFKIMEKVGMSQKEVKHTIKSQIIMVFFLPLIVAGVHVVFAFPILLKLLNLLLMPDTLHCILCTVIVFIVFAILYALIYSGTSKTYYNIVK